MVASDVTEPLEALQAQTGAQMIYRVSQQESKVRLEGRAGSRTCLFEADQPEGVARALLGAQPSQYLLAKPEQGQVVGE